MIQRCRCVEFHHHVTLRVTTYNRADLLALREMMEPDVPDDVLDMYEDWQDISQYSFDPEDRLETVTLLDSQQSSQASDKTDVFLGWFDDEKPSDYVDVKVVPACLNNETQQVISEDTGDLCDYRCPTDVTNWLAPVSNSQELPAALWLEEECQQTFVVQVLKAKSLTIMYHYSLWSKCVPYLAGL